MRLPAALLRIPSVPADLAFRIRDWRRNARLMQRPFYRRFPPPLSAGMAEYNCLVAPNHSYCYFRIPKVANSAISETLAAAESGLPLSERKRSPRMLFPRLSDLAEDEVAAFDRSIFKFAFVRDPYSRFLSAYRDKLGRDPRSELDNGIIKAKVARALWKSTGDPISIDEFLDYLENGGLNRDVHWARQTDLICIPVTTLDLLGRLEYIDADMERLTTRLFGRAFPITGNQGHATGASAALDELSAHQRRRIHRLYEADFDLLHYPSLP